MLNCAHLSQPLVQNSKFVIYARCLFVLLLYLPYDISLSAVLQPESDTGTREHVIELSLPKISSIGHVEVKFALRPSATEIPDVKVALLCYKLENRNLGMVSDCTAKICITLHSTSVVYPITRETV